MRRYRRSPSLVFYWDDGRFVAHNYRSGRRMVVDPELVPFLDRLDASRASDRVLTELSRHTLVEPGALAAAEGLERWREWGVLATAFHFGTKDVPFNIDPRRGERRLRRKAKRVRMPPPVKRVRPGAAVTMLPPPEGEDEYVHTLLDRRTWRDFGRRDLPLTVLGTLLHLTWGVQRRGVAPGQGRVVLKTSPSAGACHPIEVYVVALRVAGLPAGTYHYDAEQHRLTRIRAGATPGDIGRYLPGQVWFRRAAALFLMTAVFERTQWRYATARAYRAILLDAGHLCQTFCLTASWLKLAPFCSMALADSAIERDLGVDGVSEGVVYAAGVGSRPRGGWRAGVPGLR